VALCGRCVCSPPSFESAIAAVDYSHPWDRLISDFKYRGELDLGGALCGLLMAAHQHHAGDVPDWLLPVPLGAQRLRERGYNQSWELARRCAHRLGCRTDASMLLRIRETPHQLSLPRERRLANVRGAFAIEPTRRAEVIGRRVALIDDVMTTQATADELSQVLLDAGALSVQVWVVARTPPPEH
jgi:ComF family protein